ncbi:MAG: hypothetical protein ACM3PT_02305 [Deltaproteobacteria bacterium]
MKNLVYLFFLSLIIWQCSPVNSSRLNLRENLAGKSLYQSTKDCIIDFDDFDKITRIRIIGLKNERLFTFTHEKLSNVFVDRPFMETLGSLSKNNKNEYFVLLTFIIDTKYVKSTYNGISTSNMLRISLINGEPIFLTNILNDQGKIDKNTGALTYTGIFPVSKKNLKMLGKYEMDKIGVMWNGGFEEYNVFNLDLFRRQYKCLKDFKFK